MDTNKNCELLAYYNAQRDPLTHKGDYGRVFIAAGSEGMTGAALLCAEGALRAGAGLVYLFAPGGLLPVYEMACREAVKIKVGDGSDFCFRERHASRIAKAIKAAPGRCVVVIGPGLGRLPDTERFVYGLMEELDGSGAAIVLDADGLNAYRGQAGRLIRSAGAGRLVLTPHAAELSRLTGIPLDEIGRDRKRAALETAGMTGAVTVLKGSGTVIADVLPTKEVLLAVNDSGNPGMATGGSGDVLAGILAGILASDCGESPSDSDRRFFDLVRCGVYIHGICGDLAARRYGQRAVKAGDLTEMLKEVHQYGG